MDYIQQYKKKLEELKRQNGYGRVPESNFKVLT
jgi:hypothetical protein